MYNFSFVVILIIYFLYIGCFNFYLHIFFIIYLLFCFVSGVLYGKRADLLPVSLSSQHICKFVISGSKGYSVANL
jgi:hypothetical protein